jgi:hypothetical protein
MEITKTGQSKYGFYLLTSDKKFIGTTEAVSRFLSDKTPCTVDIESEEGEGQTRKVTKVKVLSSTPTEAGNYGKQYTFEKARDTKHVEIILSYAKDLMIADKIENLNDAVDCLMVARDKIINWNEQDKPSTD